ncbi:hypothetical protein Angca_008937, partial [Angiostrongylus cantonensis]
SVIASVCGNSIDILLTYLAAIDLGGIVVPVNPSSKQCKSFEFEVFFFFDEIENYLTTCNVQYVLTESHYAKRITGILHQCKHSSISMILLEELSEAEHGEQQLQAEAEVSLQLSIGDTAFIFFSSGTTGPPKPIRHSHRSLLAHLCQLSSIMDVNSTTYPFPLCHVGDIIHGVLPYFHAGGLITIFCMLFQGATVVINRKWNQERFLRVIQEYKITTINIVPPILEFLVKHPLVNFFDLSSLRTVYVGAAKSDENLLRCLKHRLPGLQDIIQLFGMTETGMLIFVTPSANSILSSVGRAMPGVKAKVNPYEIEEAIKLNVAGVSECVVIAVDDETDGQRPKAFIVGQVDPNDVIEFVRGMGT